MVSRAARPSRRRPSRSSPSHSSASLPWGGFFGKFFVLADALRAGIPSLAIVLALTSAVSVIYYLRLARAPYAEASTNAPVPSAAAIRTALVVCGVGVLTAAFFSAPLFSALGLTSNAGTVLTRR